MSCHSNIACQTGDTGDSGHDGYIDSLPKGLQDDGSKPNSVSQYPTPQVGKDTQRMALTSCESLLMTRNSENLTDDPMSCLSSPSLPPVFFPETHKVEDDSDQDGCTTGGYAARKPSKRMSFGIEAVWQQMSFGEYLSTPFPRVVSTTSYLIDLYRSYTTTHTLRVLYPVENVLTLSCNRDSRNNNRNSKSSNSSNNSNSTCSSSDSSSSSSSSRSSISRCRRSVSSSRSSNILTCK